MKVRINGKHVDLPEEVTTVQQLIEFYGIGDKIVVVEQNQTIVEKAHFQEQVIHSEDKIEIVNFVGGG